MKYTHFKFKKIFYVIGLMFSINNVSNCVKLNFKSTVLASEYKNIENEAKSYGFQFLNKLIDLEMIIKDSITKLCMTRSFPQLNCFLTNIDRNLNQNLLPSFQNVLSNYRNVDFYFFDKCKLYFDRIVDNVSIYKNEINSDIFNKIKISVNQFYKLIENTKLEFLKNLQNNSVDFKLILNSFLNCDINNHNEIRSNLEKFLDFLERFGLNRFYLLNSNIDLTTLTLNFDKQQVTEILEKWNKINENMNLNFDIFKKTDVNFSNLIVKSNKFYTEFFEYFTFNRSKNFEKFNFQKAYLNDQLAVNFPEYVLAQNSKTILNEIDLIEKKFENVKNYKQFNKFIFIDLKKLTDMLTNYSDIFKIPETEWERFTSIADVSNIKSYLESKSAAFNSKDRGISAINYFRLTKLLHNIEQFISNNRIKHVENIMSVISNLKKILNQNLKSNEDGYSDSFNNDYYIKLKNDLNISRDEFNNMFNSLCSLNSKIFNMSFKTNLDEKDIDNSLNELKELILNLKQKLSTDNDSNEVLKCYNVLLNIKTNLCKIEENFKDIYKNNSNFLIDLSDFIYELQVFYDRKINDKLIELFLKTFNSLDVFYQNMLKQVNFESYKTDFFNFFKNLDFLICCLNQIDFANVDSRQCEMGKKCFEILTGNKMHILYDLFFKVVQYFGIDLSYYARKNVQQMEKTFDFYGRDVLSKIEKFINKNSKYFENNPDNSNKFIYKSKHFLALMQLIEVFKNNLNIIKQLSLYLNLSQGENLKIIKSKILTLINENKKHKQVILTYLRTNFIDLTTMFQLELYFNQFFEELKTYEINLGI